MKKLHELVHTPWQIAAAALLGALFAVTVFRGATQAISHDEGVMYQWFESGPWSQLFGSEFGNHHPPTVLLSRISVSLFGLSEFTLRLPSVLGGVADEARGTELAGSSRARWEYGGGSPFDHVNHDIPMGRIAEARARPLVRNGH
jgi:hypothetical protein